MFGAKIEAPTPVSVAQMQRELTEAALDSEEKNRKWQEVKMNSEVAKCNEYKEKVLQWQCRSELAIQSQDHRD